MLADQSDKVSFNLDLMTKSAAQHAKFSASSMRFERAFFWLAPLSGFLLLLCVLLYGLASDHAYFELYHFSFRGIALHFSFYSAVIFLWFFILDGTHLFHSLARVLLIPSLFIAHRKALCFSFLFFALGPVAVLLPSLAKHAWQIEPQSGFAFALDLLPTLLLSCYFVWAYLHVTQQHWGFASMKIKYFQSNHAKSSDQDSVSVNIQPSFEKTLLQKEQLHNALRRYYLFCTPIAPVTFFMLDGHVLLTGNSRLAIAPHLAHLGVSTTQVVCTAFVSFACATALCLIDLRKLVRAQHHLSFSLLCSSTLLHLCVMSLPPLALFVHPIITVGHDVQYHLLCVLDGRARAKSALANGSSQRALEGFQETFFNRLYSNTFFLGAACLIFAVLSTSPFFWADHLESVLRLLPFPTPEASPARLYTASNHFVQEPTLAYRLLSAFCIGFAAQHYYLDGKIWKLSRNKDVKDELRRALFRTC